MSLINFKFAHEDAVRMLATSIDTAEIYLEFGAIYEGMAEVHLAIMIDGERVCYSTGDPLLVYANSTLRLPGHKVHLTVNT